MPNIFHYNILVTLDRNYLKVLSVMLYSLIRTQCLPSMSQTTV